MAGAGAERGPGRARDPEIDARVRAAAARHLAVRGYTALSIAAVAHEAGTTRQALYRRWPDKASLAADALLAAAGLGAANSSTGDASASPLADFRRGVSLPGRLSLASTMLQESTAPVARARYQGRVVAPRRARIRAILDRAVRLGLADAGADLELAVSLGTGSWYALALAGQEPPADWPERTAALVWRAIGGSVPPG
jgi:AcrR family transcriptional regulator